MKLRHKKIHKLNKWQVQLLENQKMKTLCKGQKIIKYKHNIVKIQMVKTGWRNLSDKVLLTGRTY